MERLHALVCAGTGCTSSQSALIIERLNEELVKFNLQDEVKIVKTGCFGLCQKGPIMAIYPDKIFYCHVSVDDVPEIVSEHFYKGRPVKRLELSDIDEITKEKIFEISKIRFYAKQKRVALRNCGVINPEDINEYIAKDGYQALGKVLTQMTSQAVIDEIKRSGLRGRGGGGFPTGIKWQFAADQTSDEKYVICNADEGDPGAFMDRSILEGDPHAVLEAMAIAGYAIGAKHGYVYIRAEYPIAVERLKIAIKQAEKLGLFGKDILGTGFEFNVEIRLGAGAFVCGEETALIMSIEGKRGMPNPKPPFPAIKGVWGKPTIINNVETFANITQIIINGADWFRSMGTNKSPGTKVFALGGKIVNTGLVEIPMGTTLREVIYEIGGGCPNNKNFKAVQTGGPSGGCLTEKDLNTPIDFDNLTALGSMMGSGGMIVVDEDNCMVDVARFYMEFICDESCGKCTPCRIGTKRMLELLTDLCEGRGSLATLDELESLGNSIKETALCGLGQTAPNPVLSTMRLFKDEYLAHAVDHKCPAGVCKNLLTYSIDPLKCKKCSLCAKNCPVDAISGEVGKTVFTIDAAKCIKCGACLTNCRFNAVIRG
ncbi:MAG: NADH-quinone oxidoreductase subunit NuoF [Erysipelotrichaceae bacterium]|nr:NADH-quinone oxidoreductase subunit NuoF [Erysipelotrichaceae bacterium]MDD4641909.1 NADH-quinone oxidoreductase subunit NuoF [Erysipelotrichaceae bacterium]